MSKKQSSSTVVSPNEIKSTQHELYQARIKNTLKSLDNVTTIRQAKKKIAQQKTALTAN